jgi:hypothetical protein
MTDTAGVRLVGCRIGAIPEVVAAGIRVELEYETVSFPLVKVVA